MPSLVDTHSHIYTPKFTADIDQVIERAREAGVETIIVPATRPSEFEEALALVERYPEVRAAIGVHPHHAGEIDDADLETVRRIALEGRSIAVGEIGIDYYYEYAPREIQHDVFRKQLRIAKELDLPAVVHNRDSDEDLLRIIREEQDGRLRFQLHCFSSGAEILERALALGAMISFTGNITYSKGTLDEVVRAVPDDRIMIETDAPYLTPVPHRGKRNEPGFVAHVAAKVAELRGTSLEDIASMTTDNARRFFRLAALSLLLLILSLPSVASAQGGPTDVARPSTPAKPDTTTAPRSAYDKWLGVGGHLASTSVINGAITEANSVIGYGGWLTVTPLLGMDVDWLQLDFTYTYSHNTKVTDSNYTKETGELVAPPNDYYQTGINLRFIGNPKSVINLHLSLGLSYYRNEYGPDKWAMENVPDPVLIPDYIESGWGLSGAFGFSANIKTPYGIVAPTAEWYMGKLMGDRKLPLHQGEFFVSQPRIGILYYPELNSLLGM